MQIKIVGGKSTAGRISILSDEFIATAHGDDQGGIGCEVKRHSSLSRFLYKNKNLPIPRLVRIILFLADGMTGKGWKQLGIFVFSFVLGVVFLSTANSAAKTINASVATLLKQYWWIILVVEAAVLAGALMYMRRRIATWHGAEHMAIAAYERIGSTNIEAIAQESPVHDKCGGRLFLPFVVGTFVASFIARSFGVNEALVFLTILECILWVDALKGWDKIPGTSQASRFLQKWITTRRPGKHELLTAQRALEELVAAHQSLAQ